MVENVPFEYGVGSTEGNKSKMDKGAYQKFPNKPWHTPLDSVGPVSTGPAPTMDHALNMIQQLSQPQYAGHGNMDSGMPEGINLMRRAVDYMNKNPR